VYETLLQVFPDRPRQYSHYSFTTTTFFLVFLVDDNSKCLAVTLPLQGSHQVPKEYSQHYNYYYYFTKQAKIIMHYTQPLHLAVQFFCITYINGFVSEMCNQYLSCMCINHYNVKMCISVFCYYCGFLMKLVLCFLWQTVPPP